MNFKEGIAKLKLPSGGYVVVGSGILNALGIRNSHDIDLVVTEEVYRSIERLGWEQEIQGNRVLLKRDVFDIGRDWHGRSAKEILGHAQIIDGIPYLNLDDLYKWKKEKAREKDLRDVALIDAYRSTH